MNDHPHPGAPGALHASPGPGGPESAPSPQVAPRSGTLAWALGFLAYVPLPFVNVLVVGVTQLLVGLAQRKHGGLAAVNGVRAANWGLTQLCWPVLMVITMVLAVVTGSPSPSGDGMLFLPVMEILVFTMIGLYFVLGILQLVYAIIGTVQTSRGHRVRLPVIPFLRAPNS